MKRKIKKFSDGGLAGIQKSSLDIAQGTGMLEQGIQRIKGGGVGVGAMGTAQSGGGLMSNLGGGRTAQSAVQQQMSNQMANVNPNNASQIQAQPYQMPANARPLQSSLGFKKGGTVKAKPKATKSTSKRGDGIAQRGKTRGKMV